jgi:uncharacterized membrane protein
MEVKRNLNLDIRNLTLTVIFAALYAALVYALPSISFQLFQVRIADALIPLSIVFGWPVIFGVTIGCAVSNVISPLPSVIIDIVLGSAANFIASFFAWKVSTWKRIKSKLNGIAVIGVMLAVLGLVFPWSAWFFPIDTISPIDAISWFVLTPIDFLGSLGFAGVCLGLGAFLNFLGALFQGRKGRAILATGTIVSSLGVIVFYSVYNLTPSIMRLLPLGPGFYVAVVALICQWVAIPLHSMVMVEAKEHIGCLTSTIIVTLIVGSYLALITNMEIWIWLLGIGIGSLISINIVGYSLILQSRGIKVLQRHST